jgi:hypothetical protein
MAPHTHTHTNEVLNMIWHGFWLIVWRFYPTSQKWKKQLMEKNHIGGKKNFKISKIRTHILHNGNNCVKDLIKAFLNSYSIESHLWTLLDCGFLDLFTTCY